MRNSLTALFVRGQLSGGCDPRTAYWGIFPSLGKFTGKFAWHPDYGTGLAAASLGSLTGYAVVGPSVTVGCLTGMAVGGPIIRKKQEPTKFRTARVMKGMV